MRYEDPILALIADLYQQIVALTAEIERLKNLVPVEGGEVDGSLV
jgi:hypothetical protein